MPPPPIVHLFHRVSATTFPAESCEGNQRLFFRLHANLSLRPEVVLLGRPAAVHPVILQFFGRVVVAVLLQKALQAAEVTVSRIHSHLLTLVVVACIPTCSRSYDWLMLGLTDLWIRICRTEPALQKLPNRKLRAAAAEIDMPRLCHSAVSITPHGTETSAICR
mmetsp:Transcript_46862/g.149624  ORF Transcript_46862/g.149624 Transcript_46862/m.149624 type:complete len:164 (+) Transcript_46862:303-794(+)